MSHHLALAHRIVYCPLCRDHTVRLGADAHGYCRRRKEEFNGANAIAAWRCPTCADINTDGVSACPGCRTRRPANLGRL